MEGKGVEGLVFTFRKMCRELQVVSTVWAVVKSVDWDKKEMVATSKKSELDYYRVRLGLGGLYYKPTVGAECLLGIIENKDTEAWLLAVDEFELVEFGGGKYSMVNGEELKKEVEKLKAAVEQIKSAIGNAAVATGAPDSGATFKVNIMAGLASFDTGNFNEILNEKLKHGK